MRARETERVKDRDRGRERKRPHLFIFNRGEVALLLTLAHFKSYIRRHL